MSTQTAIETAIQLVIMDAIEKGMPAEKAAEFLASEIGQNAVTRYTKLFLDEFKK